PVQMRNIRRTVFRFWPNGWNNVTNRSRELRRASFIGFVRPLVILEPVSFRSGAAKEKRRAKFRTSRRLSPIAGVLRSATLGLRRRLRLVVAHRKRGNGARSNASARYRYR